MYMRYLSVTTLWCTVHIISAPHIVSTEIAFRSRSSSSPPRHACTSYSTRRLRNQIQIQTMQCVLRYFDYVVIYAALHRPMMISDGLISPPRRSVYIYYHTHSMCMMGALRFGPQTPIEFKFQRTSLQTLTELRGAHCVS